MEILWGICFCENIPLWFFSSIGIVSTFPLNEQVLSAIYPADDIPVCCYAWVADDISPHPASYGGVICLGNAGSRIFKAVADETVFQKFRMPPVKFFIG